MARILIVDSEPARLKILNLCLHGTGHLVSAVGSEKEAVAALAKPWLYDLLIAGEVISEAGLARLLEGMETRPVLIRLLSAHSDLEMQRLLELTKGFDDRLESPLNISQVQ